MTIRATKTLLAVLCAFALSPGLLRAQSESPDDILAHARQTADQGGSSAALSEFERALVLYRQRKDRHGEAQALNAIGNAYEDLADYDKALDFLQRALAIKQELGDRLEIGKTLSNVGLVYWNKSDYPNALDYLNRSLAIAHEVKDQKLEGSVLNNLGLVYDDMGDYSRSFDFHKRAIEILHAVHFEEGESDALGNMGGWYLLLGRYREAIPYYQQALQIDERIKAKERASLDLGNIALGQTDLGQFNEALTTFDRALALAREAGAKKDEADWHKDKGSAYVGLGKYDLAREEFRAALDTYQAAGLKQQMIEALEDEGNLYELLGDNETAEKDFKRALELSRAIGHSRGITACLMALGDLEGRRQRYEPAAALYQEAYARAKDADDRGAMAASLVSLALALGDQGRIEEAIPNAQQSLEIARTTGAPLAEAQALYALGELSRKGKSDAKAIENYSAAFEIAQKAGQTELEWQVANGKGQALENLGRDEDALAAYQQAAGIIESVRSQLREERFQAGYIEDKYQVYVALVRLLLKAGKTKEAFLASEKLRAQSYRDLLNRTQAPVASQREADLRARIRRLQKAIEEEGSKPPVEQKREKEASYSSELSAAQRDYQALLDDLRNSRPEYAVARALVVPSTEQMQGALPADAALIEYIVGADSLAIFVLTKSDLHAISVPVRAADLQAKVELFRDLIAREGSRDWVAPGESLYRVLIEPLEKDGWMKNIQRMMLVPHGVLHYLPFAALPRPDGGDARLLVQDYVVAYLPAASVLVYGNALQAPQGNLLALAPSSARLRFTPEEARSVGSFYPRRSVVLVGAGATKSAFEKQVGDFKVIHLAAHGFFDRLNPVFSGVQLEPEAQNDGRLEVYEILRLHLRAQLVTLSACETALGSGYFSQYPAGDDIVGLTRAFLFAGSSSVMASLWEVNDRSTAQIMRRFYTHLQHTDEANALRQAQLAMIETHGRFSQPYFWAPFVLVGINK